MQGVVMNPILSYRWKGEEQTTARHQDGPPPSYTTSILCHRILGHNARLASFRSIPPPAGTGTAWDPPGSRSLLRS